MSVLILALLLMLCPRLCDAATITLPAEGLIAAMVPIDDPDDQSTENAREPFHVAVLQSVPSNDTTTTSGYRSVRVSVCDVRRTLSCTSAANSLQLHPALINVLPLYGGPPPGLEGLLPPSVALWNPTRSTALFTGSDPASPGSVGIIVGVRVNVSALGIGDGPLDTKPRFSVTGAAALSIEIDGRPVGYPTAGACHPEPSEPFCYLGTSRNVIVSFRLAVAESQDQGVIVGPTYSFAESFGFPSAAISITALSFVPLNRANGQSRDGLLYLSYPAFHGQRIWFTEVAVDGISLDGQAQSVFIPGGPGSGTGAFTGSLALAQSLVHSFLAFDSLRAAVHFVARTEQWDSGTDPIPYQDTVTSATVLPPGLYVDGSPLPQVSISADLPLLAGQSAPQEYNITNLPFYVSACFRGAPGPVYIARMRPFNLARGFAPIEATNASNVLWSACAGMVTLPYSQGSAWSVSSGYRPFFAVFHNSVVNVTTRVVQTAGITTFAEDLSDLPLPSPTAPDTTNFIFLRPGSRPAPNLFSSVFDLAPVLNNTASFASDGSVLQLISLANNFRGLQRGIAYMKQRVSLVEPETSEAVTFYLAARVEVSLGGAAQTAQGFSFFLHNDPRGKAAVGGTALGGGGNGLGYSFDLTPREPYVFPSPALDGIPYYPNTTIPQWLPNITRSVAVGVTWSGNQANLRLGIDGVWKDAAAVPSTDTSVDFASPKTSFQLRIVYSAGTRRLSASLMAQASGQVTFYQRLTGVWELPLPLEEILGSDKAYLGVASSTSPNGAMGGNVSVSHFSWSSVTSPIPYETNMGLFVNRNRFLHLPPPLLALRFDGGAFTLQADELDCQYCGPLAGDILGSLTSGASVPASFFFVQRLSPTADRTNMEGTGWGAVKFDVETASSGQPSAAYLFGTNPNRLPLPVGDSSRSVCMWLRFDSMPASGPAVAVFGWGSTPNSWGLDSATTPYFGLRFYPGSASGTLGNIQVIVGGKGHLIFDAQPYMAKLARPFSVGQWHHYCVVYGDESIVVNGTAPAPPPASLPRKALRVYMNADPLPSDGWSCLLPSNGSALSGTSKVPQPCDPETMNLRLNTSRRISNFTEADGSVYYNRAVLTLGGETPYSAQPFSLPSPYAGAMDEFSLYDVALTPDQVKIQSTIGRYFASTDPVVPATSLNDVFSSVNLLAAANDPSVDGSFLLHATFDNGSATATARNQYSLLTLNLQNGFGVTTAYPDRFGRPADAFYVSPPPSVGALGAHIRSNPLTAVSLFPIGRASRTFALWMQIPSQTAATIGSARAYVFSYGDPNALGGEFSLGVQERRLVVALGGMSWVTPPYPNNVDLLDTRWHFITIVLTRVLSLAVYVDGRPVHPYACGLATGASLFPQGSPLRFDDIITTNNYFLALGRNVDDSATPLAPALIDDFMVQNDPLADEAVYSLYLKTMRPPAFRSGIDGSFAKDYELVPSEVPGGPPAFEVPALIGSLKASTMISPIANGWTFLAANATGGFRIKGAAITTDSYPLAYDPVKQAHILKGTSLSVATGAAASRSGDAPTTLLKATTMRREANIIANSSVASPGAYIPGIYTDLAPAAYPRHTLLDQDVVFTSASKLNGSFVLARYDVPPGTNVTWAKVEAVLLDPLSSAVVRLDVDGDVTVPISITLSEAATRDFSTRRVWWMDLVALAKVATKSIVLTVSNPSSGVHKNAPPLPNGDAADASPYVFAGMGSGAVALRIDFYGRLIPKYCPPGYVMDTAPPDASGNPTGSTSFCYKIVTARELPAIAADTALIINRSLPVYPPPDFPTFARACQLPSVPQSGLATFRTIAERATVVNRRCLPQLISQFGAKWLGYHDLARAEGSFVAVSGANVQAAPDLPWQTGGPTDSIGAKNCIALNGSSTLVDVSCFSNGTIPAACCEAPVLPLNSCPPAFGGGAVPDASGYCYKAAPFKAAGYTYDEAVTECAALSADQGSSAWPATVWDDNSFKSVFLRRCNGQLGDSSTTAAFWTGLRIRKRRGSFENYPSGLTQLSGPWGGYATDNNNERSLLYHDNGMWSNLTALAEDYELWARGQGLPDIATLGSGDVASTCTITYADPGAPSTNGRQTLYVQDCGLRNPSLSTGLSTSLPIGVCCQAPGRYSARGPAAPSTTPSPSPSSSPAPSPSPLPELLVASLAGESLKTEITATSAGWSFYCVPAPDPGRAGPPNGAPSWTTVLNDGVVPGDLSTARPMLWGNRTVLTDPASPASSWYHPRDDFPGFRSHTLVNMSSLSSPSASLCSVTRMLDVGNTRPSSYPALVHPSALESVLIVYTPPPNVNVTRVVLGYHMGRPESTGVMLSYFLRGARTKRDGTSYLQPSTAWAYFSKPLERSPDIGDSIAFRFDASLANPAAVESPPKSFPGNASYDGVGFIINVYAVILPTPPQPSPTQKPSPTASPRPEVLLATLDATDADTATVALVEGWSFACVPAPDPNRLPNSTAPYSWETLASDGVLPFNLSALPAMLWGASTALSTGQAAIWYSGLTGAGFRSHEAPDLADLNRRQPLCTITTRDELPDNGASRELYIHPGATSSLVIAYTPAPGVAVTRVVVRYRVDFSSVDGVLLNWFHNPSAGRRTSFMPMYAASEPATYTRAHPNGLMQPIAFRFDATPMSAVGNVVGKPPMYYPGNEVLDGTFLKIDVYGLLPIPASSSAAPSPSATPLPERRLSMFDGALLTRTVGQNPAAGWSLFCVPAPSANKASNPAYLTDYSVAPWSSRNPSTWPLMPYAQTMLSSNLDVRAWYPDSLFDLYGFRSPSINDISDITARTALQDTSLCTASLFEDTNPATSTPAYAMLHPGSTESLALLYEAPADLEVTRVVVDYSSRDPYRKGDGYSYSFFPDPLNGLRHFPLGTDPRVQAAGSDTFLLASRSTRIGIRLDSSPVDIARGYPPLNYPGNASYDGVVVSISVFGVNVSSLKPAPSPTPTASPFGFASPSAAPTAVATPTPLPVTPLQLKLRFSGAIHTLHNWSGLTTIVSRGIAGPELSVSVTGGSQGSGSDRGYCLNRNDFSRPVLRCSSSASLYSSAPEIEPMGAQQQAAVLAARRAAEGSSGLLSLQPVPREWTPSSSSDGSPVVSSGCVDSLAEESVFRLHDPRNWDRGTNSSSSAAADDPTGAFAGCPFQSLASPLPTISGHNIPLSEVVRVQCRLLSYSSASTNPTVLAEGRAYALVLRGPLPIIDNIMVYRPAQNRLQALGASISDDEPVDQPRPFLSAKANEAIAKYAPAVPTANRTVAAALITRALAAAAFRLHGRMKQREAASSSSSASVAISTTSRVVIMLNHRASPPYVPPHTALRQYYDEIYAHDIATRSGAGLPSVSPCINGRDVFYPVGYERALQSYLAGRLQVDTAFPLLELAVYVGSVRANVTWFAPDGTQLHVDTPSNAAVCAAAAASAGSGTGGSNVGTKEECGYQPISLRYERVEVLRALKAANLLDKLPTASRLLRERSPRQLQNGRWMTQWLASTNESALSFVSRLVTSAGFYAPSPVMRCPPFCGGSILPSRSTVPMAVPAASLSGNYGINASLFDLPPARNVYRFDGVLVPALPANVLSYDSDAAADLVPALDPIASLASLMTASSAGLFFTTQCAGYTDLTSGACSNVSHPDFGRCAFGSGDDCRPCPVTSDGKPMAICPGGKRLIVLPGFYTATESSGVVEACPPPAASRCLGWDASYGTVQCGEGYRRYSYKCSACDDQYYQKSDGSCGKCPQASLGASELSPLLATAGYFAGGIAAAVFLILGTSYLVAKCMGGSVAGASKRSVDLVLFLIMLLQVLAAVGKSASPGLPSIIQSIFSGLGALQLEMVSSPAACWSGLYPFAAEVSQFTVALALSLGLWVWLLATKGGGPPVPPSSPAAAPVSFVKRICKSVVGILPGSCFAVLSLLYSIAASSALTLINCKTIQTSPLGYTTLNRDDTSITPETLLASGMLDRDASLVSVSVLASNPSYVCYQGDHKAAGILAWLTLVLVTVGYPLWSWLWLRWRLPVLAAMDIYWTANADANAHAAAASLKGGSHKKLDFSWWHRLGFADRAELRKVRRKWGWFRTSAMLCLCGRERTLTRWWRLQNPDAFKRAMAGAASSPSCCSLINSSLATCALCCCCCRSRRRGAGKAAARRGSVLDASLHGADDDSASSKTMAKVVVKRFTSEEEEFSPLLLLGADKDSTATDSEKGAVKSEGKGAKKGKGKADATRKSKASAAASAAPAVVTLIVPGILQPLALDRSAAVTSRDAASSHFVGTAYRARMYYSRQIDMLSLGALAAIQYLWPAPSTVASAAGRGGANIAVLLAVAWYFGTRRPDVPGEEWKTAVKVSSLIVAALGSLLTSFSLAVDLQYGNNGSGQGQPGYDTAMAARTGLSWVFLSGCVLLAIIIVAGFWSAVVRGAEREEEELQEERQHPEARSVRAKRKFGSLAVVAAASSVQNAAVDDRSPESGSPGVVRNAAAIAAGEALMREALAAFAPAPPISSDEGTADGAAQIENKAGAPAGTGAASKVNLVSPFGSPQQLLQHHYQRRQKQQAHHTHSLGGIFNFNEAASFSPSAVSPYDQEAGQGSGLSVSGVSFSNPLRAPLSPSASGDAPPSDGASSTAGAGGGKKEGHLLVSTLARSNITNNNGSSLGAASRLASVKDDVGRAAFAATSASSALRSMTIRRRAQTQGQGKLGSPALRSAGVAAALQTAIDAAAAAAATAPSTSSSTGASFAVHVRPLPPAPSASSPS